MAKDYYELLGVKKSSTDAEIRKSYRKLARKYHPDVNPGDKAAEAKFKEISSAYRVLSDPEKRKQYDQFGGMPMGEPRSNPNPDAPPGGFSYDYNPESFFSGSRSGSFKDFFADIFAQEQSASEADDVRKGSDINYSIDISFLDAYRGMTTNLQITAPDPCPSCSGSGQVRANQVRACPDCRGTGRRMSQRRSLSYAEKCAMCHGTGRVDTIACKTCSGKGVVQSAKTISVKIPAGVDTGSRVRIPAKGEPGRSGGLPGDLYITVKVSHHPFFNRSGKNLLLEAPITIAEAVLGARIMIPTMEGEVKMTIPPGTSSKQVFRLSGKGFPDLRGDKPGDLLVTVNIVSPQKVNEKAKDLMREFDRLAAYAPRDGRYNR
jgi:molecular chaperone DnaJ